MIKKFESLICIFENMEAPTIYLNLGASQQNAQLLRYHHARNSRPNKSGLKFRAEQDGTGYAPAVAQAMLSGQ
jgi:hypothetical protein